jgi:hypothetical protein
VAYVAVEMADAGNAENAEAFPWHQDGFSCELQPPDVP